MKWGIYFRVVLMTPNRRKYSYASGVSSIQSIRGTSILGPLQRSKQSQRHLHRLETENSYPSSDKYCLGSIFKAPGLQEVVIGGTFLKDRVLVFDQDKRRIGIAAGVSLN